MASCLGGLLASRRSRPRVTELETTTSTCSTEAVRRKHVFEIQGYRSLLGRLGPGQFVKSATFEAGGHDWAVRYYPHGCPHASPGYVSVFVEAINPAVAGTRASCELSLLPAAASGRSAPHVHRTGTTLFRRRSDGGSGVFKGSCSFVKRKVVEESAYLHDDTVRIQCAVTVFQEPTNSGARVVVPARVGAAPPSEMASDIAKLLDFNDGAPVPDVTVFVGQEVFLAHGVVLWARCRRLYDRMRKAGWASASIPDSEVRPDVFRALLHYIYTDSLPAMDDDLDAAGKVEMMRCLLAAAHRYGVERLKVMCERALCSSIQAGTVVATLALAEQLQCSALREACIKFIGSRAARGSSMFV